MNVNSVAELELNSTATGKPASGRATSQVGILGFKVKSADEMVFDFDATITERSLSERVRELLPAQGAGDADEPWELLTDCLLLRDGLIEACREIEAGVRATRERLDELFDSCALERERAADPRAEPVAHGKLESAA